MDFDPIRDWFQTHGLRILLITVLTLVILKLIGLASNKVVALMSRKKRDIEHQKRADTLSAVVRWCLRLVVVSVAIVMVLGELGVQIGPILAAAGVVGLAIGFGAQNLVQDFITGFFILLEDQIRVGDVVQIGSRGGLVEQVQLRMVILRDLSGNVHFIRNSKIDIVTNMTKDFSRYVFDVGVAYREDVDEVIAVLKSIDEELRNDPAYKEDIIAPLEVMGLDRFGDSSVIVRARTTTKPIQQWRVGREFNKRLKKRFDELGIEIPYPHQTLYIGRDKKGQAPALKVELNQKED